MKLEPMAAAHSAFGAIVRTRAPRRRSASASTDTADRATLRMIVSIVWRVARLAVGFRHRTWVSRPAGATSRLVGLHTPPSTYSRRPILTGANSHGTVQDASTASATLAGGAPGLPNTTRRPEPRSTAVTRSRPSNRAPDRSTWARRALRATGG